MRQLVAIICHHLIFHCYDIRGCSRRNDFSVSLRSEVINFHFRLQFKETVFKLNLHVTFFSRGSTVYWAALGIKKAFDSVRHDKLFDTLLKAGLPNAVVEILRNWFRRSCVVR
jgi:hypothetical protein